MSLLVFNQNGIYCPQADVYIDPWRSVPKAVITHAHSDHARWGNKYYLAQADTIPLLHARLGISIHTEGMAYGKEVQINGVKISLHPAGHVVGSAQVRLEYKGEVWVVSGDYKLQNDQMSTPFESVKCHTFITESTFGMPHYHFPNPLEVHAEINNWWKQNRLQDKCTVLIGYSLGKAQRLLKHLDPSIGTIYVHGAVANMNNVILSQGYTLPPHQNVKNDAPKTALKGCIVVAPPSVLGSPWLTKFEPYSVGIASGWMQLRGARRRQSADRGFVLSDHADWGQLNEAINLSEAQKIYVTHGYKSVYARWLRERYGLDAMEVDTLYEGESLDKKEATDEEVR